MDLNIIGNGFDLFHGLPSSYYYFGCYLIDNNPEFYEEIGKIYDLKYRNIYRTYPDIEFYYTVEDIFWRDFEKHLGDANEDFVLGTYEDDLRLENPDPVDIQMNEDLAANNLVEQFTNWVKNTLDKKVNFQIINAFMNEGTNKIDFGQDDYFLVFNYIHTLQEIYNISDHRIYYVHGECKEEDEEELIIGHGNEDRIEKIEKIIESYEEEYDFTQSSRNRINEYECLLRYLKRLQKDVDICKSECKWFYYQVKTKPEFINVYGMSLGEVDIPYLKQLREKWPEACWRFSYYSMNDRARAIQVAKNILQLEDDKYDVFEFINPVGHQIQQELIQEQGIIEYSNV